MRLNELLLEIKKFDVYSPEAWEEYISCFVNNKELRRYIEHHSGTYQPYEDPAKSLIPRIRRGRGADPADVDSSLAPKVVTIDDLSDPEVRTEITLGIVSGSFDLLHLGHVRYMLYAKKYLKDYHNPKLCALTLSDEHIRAKKGERTPIMNINERLKMICGVECIDYAIALEEPNCLVALGALRPEYFFKAQKDRADGIVNQETLLVESYGGSVIISPPGPPGGQSTGQIIQKVFERIQ